MQTSDDEFCQLLKATDIDLGLNNWATLWWGWGGSCVQCVSKELVGCFKRSRQSFSRKANLIAEGNALEEEILSVLNIPPGSMGYVISRKGSSILSIKESCDAEILIGGAKGPPDKVFIVGPVKQVRKAEAILRGRINSF